MTTIMDHNDRIIDTWTGNMTQTGGCIEWNIEQGDLFGKVRIADWLPYRILKLKLHTAKQTGARIRLEILGPDRVTLGYLIFALDWVGENDMQLWLDNFQPLTGNRDRWVEVEEIRFSCEKSGLWPSVLGIGNIELSQDNPAWEVNESDTLIDIGWHYHFARSAEWRINTTLSNISPEKSLRISPQPMTVINREEYPQHIPGDWEEAPISAWLEFGYAQEEKPGVLTMERKFDVDIVDGEEILGMMVWDKDTRLTVTALVDNGKEIVVVKDAEPADQWLTIGISLQGAKHLEGVRLSISEQNDRTVNNRKIMMGLFWLLLRKPTLLDSYPCIKTNVRLLRGWAAKPEEIHTMERSIRQIPYDEPVESVTPIGDPLQNGLPFGFFVRRKDLPALRQKVQSDPAKPIFDTIRQEADLAISTDLVDRNVYGTPYGGGVGLPKGVRGGGMRIFAPQTALVHLVTGEEKYAIAARCWILRSALSDDWRGDHGGCVDRPHVGDILPYWSSFTGWYPKGFAGYMDHPFWVADSAFGIVLAYDMLYHCFSPSERELVEDSFKRNGIYILADKLLQSRDYYVRMNQGILFALPLLMQLAIIKESDPVYTDLYEWTLAFLQEFGSRPWNEEGVLGEGPGYGAGTLSEYVEALLPISACMGKDVTEIIPQAMLATMTYIQHIRSTWSVETTVSGGDPDAVPSSFQWQDPHFLGFSDGSEYGWLQAELVAFFANIAGDPVAQYFWEERFSQEDHVSLPLLFYIGSETKAHPPVLPPAKVYRQQPVAFFRTGWQYGDTLVSLLNLRQVTGHGHRDRGSIVFEYNQEQLLLDPGMISYSDPAAGLFHETFCHNTLTFGQKSQVLSIQEYDTNFIDFLSTSGEFCPGDMGGIDWVIADAGAVYPQVEYFHRHVIFLRPDVCVLYDEVLAKQPEMMEVNFNCLGALEKHPLDDGSDIFYSTTKLNQLLLHTQATVPLNSQTGNWATHWKEIPSYRLVRSTQHAAKTCNFLTLLAAHALDKPLPLVKSLKIPGWLGVEVVRGGLVEQVYFRQESTTTLPLNIETDGCGLVLRSQQGNLTGAAIWKGSYLQYKGLLLEADEIAGNFTGYKFA